MADYTLADYLQGIRPNALMGDPRSVSASTPPEPRNMLGELHGALSSFGEPSLNALQANLEAARRGERPDPSPVAWSFLTEGPMGPFGSVRTPTYVLSANRVSPGARYGYDFDYGISREGRNLGSMSGWVDGDTARIAWIGPNKNFRRAPASGNGSA